MPCLSLSGVLKWTVIARGNNAMIVSIGRRNNAMIVFVGGFKMDCYRLIAIVATSSWFLMSLRLRANMLKEVELEAKLMANISGIGPVLSNTVLAAVGSSYEASAASASLPPAYATWSYPIYGNDTTTVLPNQTKVSKALRCEVCKIDLNSKDSYEKHIAGKKHKKNLQVQTNPTIASHVNVQCDTSSTQGQSLIGPVAKKLEPKKKVVPSGGTPADSAKVCSTCNVLCTSQDTYNKHIAGKKHANQLMIAFTAYPHTMHTIVRSRFCLGSSGLRQLHHDPEVRLLSNNGIGPSSAEFKRSSIGPLQKAAKKIKVAQSAWCEVCKITCNSMDIYITHLAGKKHLKNLEKLSNPKTDAGTGATTTSTAANTLIGPQEKPDTDKPNKAPELDIETKKRKVVEGGAAVNHIKMCTLCNVVCNSQIVFDSHLVGQKHAAMAKKAGSSTG
ncbi:zinc finger RNA-binding protein-like [Trifolium pratense]|uniref:Zinc finger RNA-binding protein-like n=1 Tax=Trifolium pratense TaxID=57577 RepID=A0A2K3P0Z8_TRIPR|nr:zinc finger RNA-binding protein-like [Trifolium pratense]